MRRLGIALGIWLFASSMVVWSAEPSPPAATVPFHCPPDSACQESVESEALPDWCKPGYICLTRAEAVSLNRKLIEMERDLKTAKARSLRRLGWSAGPYFGYDATKGEFAIGIGLVYGFRW